MITSLGIFDTVATTPVDRLSPEECANSTEVALVAQEVGLLFTLGPEADGIRQGVHGLSVAANEGTAKVDVLDLVFLRLQICDLSDVITVSIY